MKLLCTNSCNILKSLKSPSFFIVILILLIAGSYQVFVPYLTLTEEPHYISISWLMWISHNWIVLQDSSGLYLNKPPLLFWMVNIVWHVVGLNSWVFRAIPALAVIGIVLLLKQISKHLFSEYLSTAWIASALFIGCWYNAHCIPVFMFDMLLAFFITLSLLGLSLLITQNHWGWLWLILGNTLGLLTKGPVIFLFTLIPAMLLPLCFIVTRKNAKTEQLSFTNIKDLIHWYFLIILGFFISTGLAALWAVPLLLSVDWHHLFASLIARIFATQHLYGHRVWWFYLIKFPSILLPWTLWPQLYRALWKSCSRLTSNPALFWLGCSIVVIFIIMNALTAKSTRYIMPLSLYTVLFFYYSLSSSDKNNSNDYRNYPLLIILLISSMTLIFLSFPIASPLLLKFISQAYPAYRWYYSFIFGIISTIISLFFLKKPQTLSYSVFTQCILMCLIVIGNAVGPEYLSLQAAHIQEFEQCIKKKSQELYPVAYQERYAGYWFHVDNHMLPPGITLKNDYHLSKWLKHNPNGLLIMEGGDTPLKKIKILCELNQDRTLYLQAVRIKQ